MRPKVRRTHTCPVVYLHNFATVTQEYYAKKFDKNTLRNPNRREYEVYTHDKGSNSALTKRTLKNVGINKNFYEDEVESYLREIEKVVADQFKKIRNIYKVAFVDIMPIYRFIMSQLVRTPKFRDKIRVDLEFMRDLDEPEFKESIMRLAFVPKPSSITDELLHKIQQDLILINILEREFKRFNITVLTNETDTPFITSDSPVVYNNVEFLYSFLESEQSYEPTLMFDAKSIFYFPISPKYALLIHEFDINQEVKIHDRVITEKPIVLQFNILEYQYSKRFIFAKNDNNQHIQSIRKACNNQYNREYLALELTHKNLEKKAKKK